MSNFNHYHDMDHDGDHDLKDRGMFHDTEEYHGKVQPAGEDEFYQFVKALLIIGGIILVCGLLFS